MNVCGHTRERFRGIKFCVLRALCLRSRPPAYRIEKPQNSQNWREKYRHKIDKSFLAYFSQMFTLRFFTLVGVFVGSNFAFCVLYTCLIVRNTLSTAGSSMTSSERPFAQPLLKKEESPPVLRGETSGNALEASNALNYRAWRIPRFRGLSGISPESRPESPSRTLAVWPARADSG